MILCYLILAHNKPAQLTRLVTALPEESPVYIHVDARADPAIYDEMVAGLRDRPGTTFVRRHACRWGGLGIVRGTCELIDAAVGGQRFDYATLLSGADYPIKPNAEIARLLQANRGREFIESFPLSKPNRWSDHGGLYRAPDRVVRFHLRVRSRVWRTPWVRSLPGGLQPHGGGQWWTLSRAALEHVSTYVRRNPALMRFMKGVFIPDESFIQTVLSASPLHERVTGDDLRFAIWDRPAPPYPATLKTSDLPALAASPKHFARKFDMDADAEIYRLVDEGLRGAGV